jgi:hypothetical protein
LHQSCSQCIVNIRETEIQARVSNENSHIFHIALYQQPPLLCNADWIRINNVSVTMKPFVLDVGSCEFP